MVASIGVASIGVAGIGVAAIGAAAIGVVIGIIITMIKEHNQKIAELESFFDRIWEGVWQAMPYLVVIAIIMSMMVPIATEFFGIWKRWLSPRKVLISGAIAGAILLAAATALGAVAIALLL